jgi:hypothetical protein
MLILVVVIQAITCYMLCPDYAYFLRMCMHWCECHYDSSLVTLHWCYMLFLQMDASCCLLVMVSCWLVESVVRVTFWVILSLMSSYHRIFGHMFMFILVIFVIFGFIVCSTSYHIILRLGLMSSYRIICIFGGHIISYCVLDYHVYGCIGAMMTGSVEVSLSLSVCLVVFVHLQ